MPAQPNSRALFGGGPWPKYPVLTFPSVDAFMEDVFGPFDHDAHVRAQRRHLWLSKRIAAYDAANERVRQHVNAMIARERAS